LSKTVINLVSSYRALMPQIGTRKLYYLLNNELKSLNVGRDKLFSILRVNGMLVKPKRQYHITTNSHHRFRKHKNHIKTTKVVRPEQVWVSDITYIGNRKNPVYLALVTDAYSKKIMGYNISNSLCVNGAVKALRMALRNRNYTHKIIHHSDRGLQYCSNQYQNILISKKIKPSMTQQYDPYENAIAERINGILKQEFYIDRKNLSFNNRKRLVENSIKIYNTIRPHLSNQMWTPFKMHLQISRKIITYKKKKVAI
jgi:transposase InsO family protein